VAARGREKFLLNFRPSAKTNLENFGIFGTLVALAIIYRVAVIIENW
jgi:hypothetical protein